MRKHRGWLALLCLLCLLCLLPAAALGVSFEIVDYTMDIAVGADGAGQYTETLVYTFDEAYNGIRISIRHDDLLTLQDIAIYTDGDVLLEEVDDLDGVPYTYVSEKTAGATNLGIFAPGGEGERTFRITYRIGGLAQRYQDTGRINQVLHSSETDYGRASFRITLPGQDDTQIDAFVHGDVLPEEAISLAQGVLWLGPVSIAPGDRIEVQVLFPQAWLSDAPMVDADMREEALAMEARIVADAAAEAARQERLAQILVYATLGALAVYAVVFLVIFLSMRRKYGLKHPIQPVTDESLLAGMAAAEAEALHTGSVTSRALAATLLELADRGALTMEMTEEDTCFAYAYQPDGLAPHQVMLLDWLFEGRDTLCVSQLDAGEDYQAANAFTQQYNAWKTRVQQDVRARGWVFANDSKRWGALLGALLTGLIIAGSLLRSGLWPLAIVVLLLAILFAVVFGRIRRLTDAGEAQVAAMDGFIANYQDRLAQDARTVLGHTPLLMALGYLEPLADWLDAHPQALDEHYMDTLPYWAYAGWHHSMLDMDRHVREAQSHNAGTQNAGEGGSGSSGGGGFSGGSGGSSHGA